MRIHEVSSSEPVVDPFGERQRPILRERIRVLGGDFVFETNSAALLEIVRHACEGLPEHTFSSPSPRFLIRLHVTPAGSAGALQPTGLEPPAVRPLAGDGVLCGAMEDSTFAVMDPQRRSALLVVSEGALAFPYHLRYELVEFAIYTLAARAQGLVPLHAACVGRGERGLLLIGASGAGKSTLALHCLLRDFEFLAEDSVLIQPDGLLATGLATFLHLRRDSLHFLPRPFRTEQLIHSPVIRRRSGVEKVELDVRAGAFKLAYTPLSIVAVVFLSTEPAGTEPLLAPVRRETLASRLAETQRYAAHQPGWDSFQLAVAGLPAFELRRPGHPRQAVDTLARWLERT